MAALGDGLGRVFNVIQTASAVPVALTRATSVSFVHAQPGTGTATLTFTQSDSTGVNSPIALVLGAAGTDARPANLNSRYYVGPDIGGTWTAKAATSDSVFTLGGATNDTGVITVRAEQLSDGYDEVIATASAGTCVAIIHDLVVQRRPSNLADSTVA